MGCIWGFLQLLFWLFVINFAWNFLIAPFIGIKTSPQRAALNKTRFLRLLMPLLAKVAKADGHVSEHEIDRVESIFRSLHLSPEERRYAAQIFSESKDTPEEFDAAAAAFAMGVPSFELRIITFQFLVLVACADGAVSPAERDMLSRAAARFRIPPQLAAQIFAQVAGTRAHGSSRPYRPAAPSRAQDLALLGLPPNASDDDIRKAYRKKVKELHPDRLQAQGLPEAMLKQASERMAAINAAYARLIGK